MAVKTLLHSWATRWFWKSIYANIRLWWQQGPIWSGHCEEASCTRLWGATRGQEQAGAPSPTKLEGARVQCSSAQVLSPVGALYEASLRSQDSGNPTSPTGSEVPAPAPWLPGAPRTLWYPNTVEVKSRRCSPDLWHLIPVSCVSYFSSSAYVLDINMEMHVWRI